MPALASSSSAPSKASVATSSETVKPTPALAPGAGDGAPADRRPQPPAGQPRDYQGHADDAERLAGHVADKHAERDRRARGPLEEVAVDRDARIGEREQRDDHVARPPVVHEL